MGTSAIDDLLGLWEDSTPDPKATPPIKEPEPSRPAVRFKPGHFHSIPKPCYCCARITDGAYFTKTVIIPMCAGCYIDDILPTA